jgi:glyoxylase I family protein
MSSNFSHIALNCLDPIGIEKFYSRHFGFVRARVYSPGPNQVVMIKSGNVYLELFKATEPSPVPTAQKAGPEYSGWRHICFLVDNLDEKLKELGMAAQITAGPTDMSHFIPDMRVCWVADQEGNIIELNQGYIDEANPPMLID